MTAVGKARSMGHQSTEIRRARKGELCRRATNSNGEVKRALVKTRGACLFPAHLGAENSFEHVFLEPADDRILVEQIQDRRMAFKNLRAAFSFVGDELRHETFFFAIGR